MSEANNRPTAPPELTGEALLEWDRICDELAALARLDKTDRAIVSLYCQTHQVYQEAMRTVSAFGSVVKWPNGVPGPSPFYKVSREAANQLQKLLADMGMTPAARMKAKAPTADVPAEIDF